MNISRLLPFAALPLFLGCESLQNPYSSLGDGSYCTNYPQAQSLEDTALMVPSDSTKSCEDGSSPFLYRVSYLVYGACDDVSEASDIVGGLKGIHRQFGCWKPSTVKLDPI